MKDVIKLVIALWIVKKLVLGNDLVEGFSAKIKSTIKDFIN